MAKRMRLGFVGVSSSSMSRRFAGCIKENFADLALSAAWDEDGGACKEFRDAFNIKDHADSPGAVVARCEAVIMDLKSRDTAAIAPEILRQGVPLYISKPLANNLDNGLKVLRAARETRAPLLCTSTMRYEEATQEAARKVRSGELGDIHLAFIAFHHSVNQYLTLESDWHVSLEGGGGPLFYLGVHGVDILDEIIGLEGIEWIGNSSSTLRHGDYPVFRKESVADTDAVSIRYTSGLNATLHIGSGVDYYHYGGELVGSKALHVFRTKNDYRSTVEKIVEMASTGESPLSLERMESVIRVLDLAYRSGMRKARLAYETGQ